MTDTTNPLADNTVTLDQPIIRGDQVIEHITLRKPAAGELRGIALAELLQLDVGAIIKLLPRISSPAITEHKARLMDPAGLLGAGSKIAGFLLKKAVRAELSLHPMLSSARRSGTAGHAEVGLIIGSGLLIGRNCIRSGKWERPTMAMPHKLKNLNIFNDGQSYQGVAKTVTLTPLGRKMAGSRRRHERARQGGLGPVGRWHRPGVDLRRIRPGHPAAIEGQSRPTA